MALPLLHGAAVLRQVVKRSLPRAALVVLLAAPVARAATQLTDAPHFLKLADRERIVLFADGNVAGALAEHRADGTIEVRVPRVAVADSLAGRSFDDASSDGAKTKLTVASDAQGDARIVIEPARPVARVHAFATKKPSRVTIDLLHGKEKASKEPAAAAKEKDREPAAATRAAAAESVATEKPEAAASAAPTKPSSGESVAAKGTAVAEPAAAAAEQTAIGSARVATAPHTSASNGASPNVKSGTASTAKAASAATKAATAVAANEPTSSPRPDATHANVTQASATQANVTHASAQAPANPSANARASAGASAHAADEPAAATAPDLDRPATQPEATHVAKRNESLVCRWRRVAGIAYCAPDPKGGPYVTDLGTEALAGLLDRARSGPTVRPLPARGAAEAYLNADVALVKAAQSGWLLQVVPGYEQALRAYPGFADAARARANLALVYHALGFAPELARMARASDDAVAPFAGVLLADLWRASRDESDPEPLLASGRAAGGITRCLAERVAATRAADEGRAEAFPAAFTTLAEVCPRTIVEDAETAWLRGRAMVLAGEAARGAETMAALESELPRRERGLLLADVAQAYEAAGDEASARRTTERLAKGEHGRRVAREARVKLAARDAAAGKLAALGGFADLPLEDALRTREQADVVAVGELLRGGNEITALGMISERDVDPRRLTLGEQVLLARALRRVGLNDQARRALADAAASTAGTLPDEYYDELGAQALARADVAAALAAAEEWQTARGSAQAGAIALRARARAAKGDARGASDTLERELQPIDPELARDVAVEVASELLSADPALALRLVRDALATASLPPLEPAREAAALRALAEAAEATRDLATAQEAFARLAREHAGDPAAAGAGYRAARLASAPRDASAVAQSAAASGGAAPAAAAPSAPLDDDPLSRRLAAVGRLYAEVVSGMEQRGGMQ